MKLILALRGKSNSGKSTALRYLHELLSQNGYQIINTDFNINVGEFAPVFSRNGKLIGVTSSGDTYDLVHNRLQEFVHANCYVCVCACRTFDRVPPGTNAAILEFANYSNRFVEKTFENNEANQGRVNFNDAQNLFSIISDLV